MGKPLTLTAADSHKLGRLPRRPIRKAQRDDERGSFHAESAKIARGNVK